MALAGPGASYSLNMTVVYEDGWSREWAGRVCERVAELVSKEAARTTWWKISDLGEPAVLAGAVSTAIRADVIVVALCASDGLPLPFYVWVDSWLPHHPQGTAALVALITMPENPSARLDRARNYLRAVADQGRLDFMIEERKRPIELLPAPKFPTSDFSVDRPATTEPRRRSRRIVPHGR